MHTHGRRSGLKWWMTARKPSPFLHDVVMLVIFTSGNSRVISWAHSEMKAGSKERRMEEKEEENGR